MSDVLTMVPIAMLATVIYWFAKMMPILWMQANDWRIVRIAPKALGDHGPRNESTEAQKIDRGI